MGYDKSHKLHIVTVVAVIRNSSGKYLVLKRRDDEIAYPGLYTFPGGKMEANETVEETLAKEVLEESGLKLKPGKILLKDKSILRPDGQTSKSFSYLCEAENDKVEISGDFTDYKWVNVVDLRSLPNVGVEEELIKADELYRLEIPISILQTKSVKQELI
jgi:8-oxo-dGTP diphosphatase